MNQVKMRVNPHFRLEFILSIRELSLLKKMSDSQIKSTFLDTIYEYLYLDVEIGIPGSNWPIESGAMGLAGADLDLAAKIGVHVKEISKAYQQNGWNDALVEAVRATTLDELCDKLWKQLVVGPLSD